MTTSPQRYGSNLSVILQTKRGGGLLQVLSGVKGLSQEVESSGIWTTLPAQCFTTVTLSSKVA